MNAARAGMLFVIGGAALCAFLFSAAALRAGLDSLPMRYGLAAVVGYLAFLLFVSIWINARRKWLEHAADVAPDVDLDIPVPAPPVGIRRAAEMFGGGRSGGAGATARWDGVSTRAGAGDSMPRQLPARLLESLHLDADDAGWVFGALLMAVVAIVAASYIVYLAPLLLAEIALNAVIAATVYRGLRGEAPEHWSVTVVRRTWLPALAMAVLAIALGYAVEQAVPGADSIGDLVRSLRRS